MEIRYLADHPEHVPTLAAWFHAEWAEMIPGSTPATFVERFASHLSRDALPIAWVALDGGVLLGTASLRAREDDEHRHLTPWLGGVYVRPDARGRGVGDALVRFVEGRAREMGYREMFLYATDKERYYERLGWSVLDRPLYRGVPAVLMRRDL